MPKLYQLSWPLQFLFSFQEVSWYSTFILFASFFFNLTGTKVIQFWFVTRLASPLSPLSKVSAQYCYHENIVLQFFFPISISVLIQYFLLFASFFYNLTGTKVIQFWFVTRLASPLSPLSQVSAQYCYYENIVLRFVLFPLVFDHIVW